MMTFPRLTLSFLMLSTLVSMSACVAPNWRATLTPTTTAAPCSDDLGPTSNTRLAAVQQMVEDGKPYAALAELDALRLDTPQANLVRAEALRRVDRLAQARALYTVLTNSCVRGEAQHGLGLIAGYEDRLDDSIKALTIARQTLPTQAQIRNDLGYALLLNRQWDEARFELLTALDLAPNDSRVKRNLVLLALAQGMPTAARELSERLGLDAVTLERLQKQAATLAETRNRPSSAPIPSSNQTTPPPKLDAGPSDAVPRSLIKSSSAP